MLQVVNILIKSRLTLGVQEQKSVLFFFNPQVQSVFILRTYKPHLHLFLYYN